MEEKIMKQVEKFVKEHIHSKIFFEEKSDVFSKYYMRCCECGAVTYIDIEDDEQEEYADVLIKLENKYKIMFTCFCDECKKYDKCF